MKVFYFRALRTLFQNINQSNSSIVHTFSDSHNHVFFGYYDVTPFSYDEKFILATHVSNRKDIDPSKTPLRIGYYSLTETSPQFYQINLTETWCWQQGCRLQWFPKIKNTVLYNVLRDGQYGSVVQNIKTRKILYDYSLPMYVICKNVKWGLSLNFSRLQRLRPGYGYSNLSDNTQSELCPNYDGIYRVNLSNGEKELLLSLEEISSLQPNDSMINAEHYINHLNFNPAGNRFMFFHLWVKDGSRFSRLLTADTNGENVFILNNEGPVSHYCWKSDNELLVYGYHKQEGFQYYLYTDKSNNRSTIGKNHFTEDGHPSFTGDSQYFVTDTYPDKFGEQHLLIFNMRTNSLQHINQFFSFPVSKRELRCDLHPRISPSASLLCVDNNRKNKREMIVLPLTDYLNNK